MFKDNKKVITIVIGVLVILATAAGSGYLVYKKTKTSSNTATQSNNQEQPDFNNQNGPGNIDTTAIKSSITAAVTAGTLTTRQGELLTAEIESFSTTKPDQMPTQNGSRENGNNIPSGTPPAMPENGQTSMFERTVTTLNEKGLNTTLTEVQEAHTAAEKAGITLLGGGARQGRPF